MTTALKTFAGELSAQDGDRLSSDTELRVGLLYKMLGDYPEDDRDDAVRYLVERIARIHRTRGGGEPEWVARVRKRLGPMTDAALAAWNARFDDERNRPGG